MASRDATAEQENDDRVSEEGAFSWRNVNEEQEDIWNDQSLPSIFCGVILFGLCLVGELWNETHLNIAIGTVLAAESAYMEVPCRPQAGYDGHLVHASCYFTGLATFPPQPGLANLPQSTLTGIRLLRLVEVYQWHETLKSKTIRDPIKGNRIINTWSYSLQWSTVFEDSSYFSKPTTCRYNFNNGNPCVNVDPSKQDWWDTGPGGLGLDELGKADDLRFGSYTMPHEFVNTVGEQKNLEPSCDGSFNSSKVGDFCSPFVRVADVYIYYKNLINRTEELRKDNAGDVRVQYIITKSKEASVLARQIRNAAGNRTFAPWRVPHSTNSSTRVFLIENGVHTAEGMLRNEISPNYKQTWFIRCVTFAFCFLGMFMILAPVIPQQNDTIVAPTPESVTVKIRGESAAGVSFLLASACWFAIIGGAWMQIMSSIGAILLIVAGASFIAAIATNWDKIVNLVSTPDPRTEPLLDFQQDGMTLGEANSGADNL